MLHLLSCLTKGAYCLFLYPDARLETTVRREKQAAGKTAVPFDVFGLQVQTRLKSLRQIKYADHQCRKQGEYRYSAAGKCNQRRDDDKRILPPYDVAVQPIKASDGK